MTKRYLVYDRLDETLHIGDITVVEDVIKEYLSILIRMNVDDIIYDLRQSDVDDFKVFEKNAKKLDKVVSMSYDLLLIERSDYNELIEIAKKHLSVESINETLKDEIELLERKGRYEDSELLKKCQKSVWIGFGVDDEYGSIICMLNGE